MNSAAAVCYLGNTKQDALRMGAISMSLALGLYGLPLFLNQSLRIAGQAMCKAGPLLTGDRLFFLATSGIILCLMILPPVGFAMGMLGVYRQKKEVELSCVATVMHGTLLGALCLSMQGSGDLKAFLSIVQLAIGPMI